MAEPFTCLSIGSGCKLVTTSALAHMPRPWFGLDFDKDGMLSVSDDVWFCQQAARVGIETFCDPTIRAGHIGSSSCNSTGDRTNVTWLTQLT